MRLKEDGDLLNYCCDHRIPLEICLTSNVQTGAVDELALHPLRFYYDYGLRVCLNTDNRLMSGVNMTDEFWKAHTVLGFSLPEIKDLVVYGFKSAFLHHRQKVELLDQVLTQLKEIRETPGDKVTGIAVADIPTEMFSGSSRERSAEPARN